MCAHTFKAPKSTARIGTDPYHVALLRQKKLRKDIERCNADSGCCQTGSRYPLLATNGPTSFPRGRLLIGLPNRQVAERRGPYPKCIGLLSIARGIDALTILRQRRDVKPNQRCCTERSELVTLWSVFEDNAYATSPNQKSVLSKHGAQGRYRSRL